MQVEVSPTGESRVRLDVTVTPEEVDRAIEATYRKLAQRVRVPGFRPGKAPRNLVLRAYGDDAFFHQATNEAVRAWYPTALRQSGVEALDSGEIDLPDDHGHLTPGEPFAFAATVPTKPDVHLPAIEDIKIPAPPVVVADVDVDRVLEEVRRSRATLEPAAARAAETGDVVKMNIHGRADGEEVLSQEDFQFELVDEQDSPDRQFPGLSKELVNARPGDIRETVLSLPPDYGQQELAGKSLSLRIVVKEIQRKVLPDLNDDFARTVSDTTTVQELRELIRRNLERERREEAFNKVASEVIDSLTARTNLVAPDILVEAELDSMLRDQRRYFERQGMRFEQFLIAARKSEEEYRQDLRPNAERLVKRDLILEAVADAEDIHADPDEVNSQMQRFTENLSRSERDMERLSASTALRGSIEEELRKRDAIRWLVQSVSGLTVPEDEADEPVSDAGVEPAAAETA